MDNVATKVGMTGANFAEVFNRQREPGVFHGVRQHVAEMFENDLLMGSGRAYGRQTLLVSEC